MQTLKKQIILLFITFFTLTCNYLFGQVTDPIKNSVAEGNALRFGYDLYGVKFQQYKSSRFLTINNTFNLNKWTSSKTIYQLNNIPINITTLNFNSVDLLPIEYLTSFTGTNNGTNSNFANDQTIIINSKPIQENFSILFNGYFGSQTGDPLMNIFINKDTTLHNINKIPPSGTLSISNSNNKIGYRITTGYYGSFSTGGENDDIIASINHYYFGKLNKQILFSGETFFNFNSGEVLDLNIQFMSYYGWDISPFTTSYIHFENYFHRVQLSLKNIFNNLNIYFNKDGAYGKINERAGILPSQFEQSEYSLLGRWNSSIGSNNALQITTALNYYNWKNISENKNSNNQNYFLKESSFINYMLSGTYFHYFNNSLRLKLNSQFQSQNSYKMISGKMEFDNSLAKNSNLKLTVSSIANAPNISELYGIYQRSAKVIENQSTRMFSIKGNNELNYMRSNKISVEFDYRMLNNSMLIAVEPFAESIQNSIEQETISSVKLWNTGEILRDAMYINIDRNIIYGAYFSINAKFIEPLSFISETQVILKGEAKYLPTFKNYALLSYTFQRAGEITLSCYYRSKTYWEEFIVDGRNDFYNKQGFDGILAETTVINLFYKFTLKPFYFLKSLQLKVRFENIFNRVQKFIPIGNSINRAFIFEIVGEI